MVAGSVSPLIGAIDFNRGIRPILSDNCFNPDEAMLEADLRRGSDAGITTDLGGRGFPIVPGKPAESEVIWHIETNDQEDLMPPVDSNLSLSNHEKQFLNQWIEESAQRKGRWSFETVQRPSLPNAKNTGFGVGYKARPPLYQ